MTTNTDINELIRQLKAKAHKSLAWKKTYPLISDSSLVVECQSRDMLTLIYALEREISMREMNLAIKTNMAARIAELEASQPVAPEGWKLVPTEATRSIIDAFKASWEKDDSYAEYWERMVNAAPALQEVDNEK